jgi:hypothetical protein
MWPNLMRSLPARPSSTFCLSPRRRGGYEASFGLRLVADEDFAFAPDLDVLCVPGGEGIVEAASDAATIDFLKRQGGAGPLRHLGVHRCASRGAPQVFSKATAIG